MKRYKFKINIFDKYKKEDGNHLDPNGFASALRKEVPDIYHSMTKP